VYNRCKGGVDISTKFLHHIRIFRRDRKWTMRYLITVFGLSVFNCLLVGKQQGTVEQKMTWNDYALLLGEALCRYSGSCRCSG